MTKVSDVTDAIVGRVEAILTAYTQIPESIDIQDNAEPFFDTGFAVEFGSAVPTGDTITPQTLFVDRNYIITLTQLVTGGQNRTADRETTKKDLMEDARKLIKDLHSDNFLLPLLGVNTAIDTRYAGDTGVTEFLEGDRDKYYIIGIAFTVKYSDDLST